MHHRVMYKFYINTAKLIIAFLYTFFLLPSTAVPPTDKNKEDNAAKFNIISLKFDTDWEKSG